MEAPGYGRAAIEAATETGLGVWLGIAPIRLPDGTLGTDPELGSGESFEELVRILAGPGLAAVNVMHAKPDVARDAISIIRDALRRPHRGLRRIGRLAGAELGLQRPQPAGVPPGGGRLGRGGSADHRRVLRRRA